PRISEDRLSVVIGLVIFVLALAVLANVDLIGWVVTTSVWSNLNQALGTASKTYAPLGGVGALFATYAALLAVLSAAAVALNADVKRFVLAFTAVFWIAYASWGVGSYANFAAGSPAELQKFGIGWALRRADQEWLHLRADCGPDRRQRLSALRRDDQGGGPAGALYQDRDRDSRRLLCRDRGGQAQSRHLAAVARRRRHHRGLPHLLGRGVFRRTQM